MKKEKITVLMLDGSVVTAIKENKAKLIQTSAETVGNQYVVTKQYITLEN